MSEPKAFASLSPTLLARKGAAKPAMRPQLQPLHQFHAAATRDMAGGPGHTDDLGWNDMGDEPGEASAFGSGAADPASASVVSLLGNDQPQPHVPQVVRQQAGLTELIALPGGRKRQSALARGRRAAFTLRLDAERHLKLRLASAVQGRSAQDLVTDALDTYLAELPEIEQLAASVRKRH